MSLLLPIALALTAAAEPTYQVDLTQYFATPALEQADRAVVLAKAAGFAKQVPPAVATPHALYDWLLSYDSLSKSLHRHETYVYLQAEADREDHANAQAENVLEGAIDQLDADVQAVLAGLDRPALTQQLAAEADLAPYRFFVETDLQQVARATSHTAAAVAQPALASLGDAYGRLRKQMAVGRVGRLESVRGEARYLASRQPYLDQEVAFAGLLVPVVQLRDGLARAAGYSDGPTAAYAGASLSAAQVEGALAQVRAATAYQHYAEAMAAVLARRQARAATALRPWELAAVDTYQPAPVAFADAVKLVLAAEQGMGADYAQQFARLLDPARGRVAWCHTDHCDAAGFSVGAAGTTSALFYGAYDGSTDAIRAVAHEAGHAVHRQWMNEHQPFAAYNRGPKFVFESFAIFNELLLLDHLYQTAPDPAAKAYYLRMFVEDASFQVFGSAQETDVEQSIYAGVHDGSVRSAADLDALTLAVSARYVPASLLAPADKVMWARNRLFYVDPLYDVNYLFAGLLALQYFQLYERDPQGFSRRYGALLRNGFDDTPQALLKRFLGVDLDDAAGLVGNASGLIERRTARLSQCYAEASSATP